MSNYDKFTLTEEDIKIGIEDVFTQLLLEARRKKHGAKSLRELGTENPTIVYVVGQPGSGKTTLGKHREEEYDEQGEVIVGIGSDKIATYHRYYEEVSKLLPDECYRITRQFVRPAEPQIYERIRANKLNIIRERVLNKGEKDYADMQIFKNAGYRVELDIMAVDKYESFLSCMERDIKLMELGFDARPVARANHDRMYDPMIQELIEIGKRGLSTRINVYTRGDNLAKPELAWTSDGEDKRYPNAQEAVICERAKERRKILQKPQAYLARIEEARRKLSIMVEDEKTKRNYLRELNQLEKEFLSELAYDRSVVE